MRLFWGYNMQFVRTRCPVPSELGIGHVDVLSGSGFLPAVHTMAELKLSGNHLKGSRPILSFHAVRVHTTGEVSFPLPSLACPNMILCKPVSYSSIGGLETQLQPAMHEMHACNLRTLLTDNAGRVPARRPSTSSPTCSCSRRC